jgi:hypothetical protein
MNDVAQAISDALADYGDAAADFLPDTLAVSRYPTGASDGQGGAPRAYATMPGLSAVPCRLSEIHKGSGEGVAAASVEARAVYEIKVPSALADGTFVIIQARDRLTVTTQAGSWTRLFEVVASLIEGSGLSYTVVARCAD